MTGARWFLGLSLAALVLCSAVAFHLQAGQSFTGKREDHRARKKALTKEM